MADKLTPVPGPSDGLIDVSTGKFVFHNQDMYNIQKYTIYGASRVPETESKFKDAFGVSPSEWQEDPNQLLHSTLTTYRNINAHCADFQNQTLGLIADLAGQVANHGTVAQGLYTEIIKIAIEIHNIEGNINQDPNETAEAKATRKNGLIDDVKAFVKLQLTFVDPTINSIAGCATRLAEFKTATAKDGAEVEGLSAKVKSAYGDEQKIIDDFKELSKNLTLEINRCQTEYDGDCIMAETTPAYLAVPIFGWIAAPIVAGIYGAKAVQALKDRNAKQDELKQETEKKDKALHFVQTYEHVTTSLGDTHKSIDKAVECLGRVQGSWSQLKTDLEGIQNLLNVDLKPGMATVWYTTMPMEQAKWAKVATAASAYQLVAFVATPTEEEVKANPKKFLPTKN
ncbi:hypothetical protein BC938DRAFT_473518 [Jimgerdemannia flammicorona]|uniref:Uncharacterized protein n=1 Tax=Jimgerdemannia flammicorona TaxID=994334 RepID=A0A433QTC1_9FUNG|nr:hypothetical protein BC938DRAFT_473518 [Jimgerdemannia flammicorona]